MIVKNILLRVINIPEIVKNISGIIYRMPFAARSYYCIKKPRAECVAIAFRARRMGLL